MLIAPRLIFMDKKSLLYCFGIPLLLLLWSCWQCSRLSSSDAWVIIEWGTAQHSVLTPFSRLYLAGVSVILSLIAVLASAGTVALSFYSTQQARISTEHLVRVFTRCRKMLPLLMATLMTAIGFALVTIMLYELLWLLTLKDTPTLNIKLFGMLIVVTGWLIFMVLSTLFLLKRCYVRMQSQERRVYGGSVTEDEAPGLWHWVRELAQRGQAKVPDNIVVGLFQGFYVTALPLRLETGLRLTGNTLYFPLTLAAFLDKDETAAVIGHELGHFAGQDTAYTLHFAGIYSGMKRSLSHFYQNLKFCGWLERIALYPSLHIGLWFYRRFDETVSRWSRMRELAADSAGARASSPQALASSLLRYTTLEMVLKEPVQRFFDRQLVTTNLVDTLFAVLHEQGRLDVAVALGCRLSHPTDTHPTTRERLEQVQVPLDNALMARASRQVSEADYARLHRLFADLPALCRTLTAQVQNALRANHHAYVEQLQALVARAGDTVEVLLKKSILWGNIALTAVIGLAAGGLLILNSVWGVTFLQFGIVVGGLVIMALICALSSWGMYTRVRQPLLVLHPQAIESYQLSAPLPLEKIEATDTGKYRGQPCLELYWQQAYQPPKCIVGKLLRNFIFDASTRKVIITFPGGFTQGEEGEKMTLGELHTRIRDAITAAWARKRLNEI
ncbi:M48 family metallopeptidase [Kosakonia sp. BK9b]